MSIVKVETQDRLPDVVYARCRDDLETAKVEIEVVLRETLIRLRHVWGAIIRENYPKPQQGMTQILDKLSHDLGCGKRTLFYCVGFFDQHPDVDTFLASQDKSINWRKIVTKMLPKNTRAAEAPDKETMPTSTAPPPLPDISGPLLELYMQYQAEMETCLFHPHIKRQVGIGHHFPSTKGAGGKTTIPLCGGCHSVAHNNPQGFWEVEAWESRVVLIRFMTTRFWTWLEERAK